ncbi:MAG: WecB/TagA/CpsF family glycosyltransferase, partial [Firmicutes bacterium]|nr:WecB/TagA/CpsF family glycosyltransferase [Bacillota bacterium]
GMPFQEKWLHTYAEALNAKVAVGVGGSLDVVAGRVKRAPRLWQNLHLEWLWRTLLEPKRLKRISVLPKFMLQVKRDAKR